MNALWPCARELPNCISTSENPRMGANTLSVTLSRSYMRLLASMMARMFAWFTILLGPLTSTTRQALRQSLRVCSGTRNRFQTTSAKQSSPLAKKPLRVAL